ncbi:putative ester cyclase [Nakamurella sp. UYEF19]|uniref:nuclear transport factor 2 family protein n=1 Tax=Nakamurella sp. UYEF19 TaxID=1756392 RepID=UPI003390DE15
MSDQDSTTATTTASGFSTPSKTATNGSAVTPVQSPPAVRGTAPMSALATPGSPHARFMPPDFSISMRSGYGTVYPGHQPGERRQPMRGFEETYVDIVDYILRDTSRIWDDQDVGYIYDTYAPGCRVYDDNGMKYGVERVVQETMQAINTFPETRHYADDVIWAGDEDQGFATSHRAINVGYHTGPWRWGPPTGKKINLWVIANCVTRDNAIFEEWVLYNAGARLSQVGINLVEAARTLGNEKPAVPLTEFQATEVERIVGGQVPTPYPKDDSGRSTFNVDYEVRALFHDVFNRKNLAAIDKAYAQNVRWNGPTNRTGYGRSEVKAFARSLMSTFPDLGLQVDEIYWMGNDVDGYSVSVRWSASGTHRGYGLYGKPTDRRVFMWGLNQLYYQAGRIVEDWTLFNEMEVMSQILRDEPTDLLA